MRHYELPTGVMIRENSWIAWLAAKKLRAEQVAIVIGSTIHLYKVSSSTFLQNPRWVKHELEHVRQFRKFGFTNFICRYLIESIRNGYRNNIFEIEARSAECENGEPQMGR